MPKVSIIIPAYNAMQFLPEAVNSVFQQTFDDYELLVINDGSTDGIESWMPQVIDSRVNFISQINQGPAAARNTGLIQAQGEFIAFLDADDLWEPTKLEKQVQVLDKHPGVGLVYSWVGSINSQGEICSKVRTNSVEGDVWEKLIEHNIVECGSAPMVRRMCFEEVGTFDPAVQYGQDWEMWLRIALKYPFKVIRETLVYYRAHPANRSKNWSLIEPSYDLIFNKIFALASPEQQQFKNRAYALTYLAIAWKILQSSSIDYQKIAKYQKQAIDYYPKLRYSPQYIRFQAAALLIHWFGFDGYNRIRNLTHSLRQGAISASK